MLKLYTGCHMQFPDSDTPLVFPIHHGIGNPLQYMLCNALRYLMAVPALIDSRQDLAGWHTTVVPRPPRPFMRAREATLPSERASAWPPARLARDSAYTFLACIGVSL